MTVDMQYDNLKVEKDGHVAIVTFNRPHKANALDHAHLVDIETVALSFRDDVDTRVVIFTGEGKHFSSGADLDG
ncbi:MAG: enoyl-CoA hydratase/isomerase family protein, partial [Pseudomonadales bacterium]|nr:enoyl-CoA hydratase/isomerase family protein [Pseudomonadales bacterium]